MFLAAAAQASTSLTRFGAIPLEFWVKLGAGVAVIIVAVVLLRRLAQVNKILLGVVAGVFVSAMGFSWIYERNEPHWATPAVSFLAEYFPSKVEAERR